uniref:C-type lectin domain-containing protein n=1 Tax=Sinocyclocheilus grahami TaxID=75366 RepID=A0A672QEN2_SINGR
MELEAIYENIENEDMKDTYAPQIQSRCPDEGKARKQRGSRCLVWITVGLGLICVLLLVFIILQHITITFNQTINSLQDNYTDLMTEKHQLQINFNSLSQKNMDYTLQHNQSIKFVFVCYICSLKGNGMLFISSELKSWSDSRQYCRDRGADLIIINSEEKQVSSVANATKRVWIGLSDTEIEGIMKWVDNSPLNQGEETGWSPLNSWNDVPCSEKKKGICEK